MRFQFVLCAKANEISVTLLNSKFKLLCIGSKCSQVLTRLAFLLVYSAYTLCATYTQYLQLAIVQLLLLACLHRVFGFVVFHFIVFRLLCFVFLVFLFTTLRQMTFYVFNAQKSFVILAQNFGKY